MTSLALRDVTKHFGSTMVLNNINLEVEDGEFLVLVGPSGCGKTTLLNIIAGLEVSTDGDILIGDRRVNDVHPKDRDIAMVFQSYALYPTMTVRKNIKFGLEVRGIARDKIDASLNNVADLLQIRELLDRRPSQLSGGQRQRVAMARALVRDPSIFLFDEPLSNLDAKLRVEMRVEIKRLHHRLKTTVVYVTHDQIEAMNLATRIVVLAKGVVRQVGAPQELYDNPADIFVAGFIGSPAMNLLHGVVVKHDGRLFVQPDNSADDSLLRIDHCELTAVPEDGARIVLGIRPEYVSLSDGTARHFDTNMIVEAIESNGFDKHVTFQFSGRQITGRLPSHAEPVVGKSMQVALDLSRISLFDEQSEIRISRPHRKS